MRVLLVEDDKSLAESTAIFLRQSGYVVDSAETLEIAKAFLKQCTFDLVILDRMLPDGEGLSLVSYARENSIHSRFLSLTALDDVDDIVDGLDAGVLDYMAKPFEPKELVARMQKVLRYPIELPNSIKTFGPLAFETETRNFSLGKIPLVLPRTQALVLEALMSRPGVIVDKESLLDRVYGYDQDASHNSLEAQVSRLRKYLQGQTDEIEIQTIRGRGYTLRKTQ